MPAAPKCPAYGCKFGAAVVLPRWKCWQMGGKGRFAALPGFGIYFVGVRL